ncbi:MAG: VWA domain-containing protein [Terriglobales bacterium]
MRELAGRAFANPLLRQAVAMVLLACSVCAFAKGEDKDKDKKEDGSDVKFSARTELVLIPALVSDKSGAHVGGLKKEDFTVLENGAERQIATFEEITSDPHLSRPTNPNEFTNSLAGGSTRRITLIVLDFINTPFPDQVFVRNELLKYLSQSLDRREPTGLFTLDRSGIHVIHNFAVDPGVLIAAVHKVRGEAYQLVDTPEDMEALTGSASPEGSAGEIGVSGGSGGGRPGTTAALASQMQQEADRMQTMIEDAALNFQSFQQRLAITYTLEGLQQVAQALAGFPGRKSLIWASGGFPFSVSDTTMQLAPAGRDSLTDVLPLYERTWQLLNDAQIALYPVDVRGLQSNAPGASIRTPGLPNRRPGGYVRSAGWHQIDTQSSFETFAAATGGRAYYNSNDLVKGFRDAVRDSAQYYMLGYYLDRSNPKPGWRKLSVKVKHDHVNVRSRSGFFATRMGVDSEASHDSDIASALQSPMDYTALALTGHWDATAASQEPGKKRAVYIVDLAPDPTLIDANNKNHIALELVASAITPDGFQANRSVLKKIDLYPTPELLAKIREKGIGCRGALDLAPGEYTVRIVVRDNLSGRIGSVAAPLNVN